MANLASTLYRIDGTRKAVKSLWKTLQSLEVNKKDIWLDDLAQHYGIDYEAKHISVRGHIYWAEYTEDKAEDFYHISIETETAWDACNELFEEINHCLDDELSISYRVSIMFMMRATTSLKRLVCRQPANHLRMLARMCMTR